MCWKTEKKIIIHLARLHFVYNSTAGGFSTDLSYEL